MIVLTTPTGNIGSKVLTHLLNEASAIPALRLIARDPAKLPSRLPASVQIMQGNTSDPALLRRALEGAATLFWCQPDTPAASDYFQAYENCSRAALEAVTAAGIKRIVAISAAGDDAPPPSGPVSALRAMERMLAESGASCRFLRCGSFYSNLLWQWESITREGVFAYSMPGHIAGPHVAPNDIARVAARLLEDGAWQGNESPPLCGPRNLSYDDMATDLSHHLGRRVRYQSVPAPAYRNHCVQTGLSTSAAQALTDMFDYLASGYQDDPRTDRSLTPTTFSEWLRDNAPPYEC